MHKHVDIRARRIKASEIYLVIVHVELRSDGHDPAAINLLDLWRVVIRVVKGVRKALPGEKRERCFAGLPHGAHPSGGPLSRRLLDRIARSANIVNHRVVVESVAALLLRPSVRDQFISGGREFPRKIRISLRGDSAKYAACRYAVASGHVHQAIKPRAPCISLP